MQPFQILTDSCCDLPTNLHAELDVSVIPLTLEFHGELQDDHNDDSLKALYDGFRAGESAHTSAINPVRWACAMEEILRTGRDVLAIAFSSGLSTTYQSASIAATELREKYPERKIVLVDSLSASLGEGLLVWYACQMRDAGKSLEEIATWLEENKRHLCHWFTVDDLMYLKRGGRVGATTAVVGTMLQIKPVMHVDDEGQLVSVGKARGRHASIDAIAKKLEELGAGYDNSTVFIVHGDCIEDAKHLESLLKTRYGVKNILISYVGAVIGAHSGPGTLALFFLGEHR